MKKCCKVISIIMCVVIVYFLSINIFNSVFCKAYLDNEEFTMQYNGKTYHPYTDLFDYTVLNGEPSNISGVLTHSFFDYIFFPRNYICSVSENEDVNTNFIVYEGITTIVFVEENFIFPDIKNDAVESVWLSWDTDLDVVQDENVVDELVGCAIAGEKSPLSKELYELIAECNGDSCYFKFKGYPITANFDIKTTDDGRHYLSEQTGYEKYAVFLDQKFLDNR